MYEKVTTIKPLYLSEEEAMALLDLCLTSAVELDEVKERAVRKITDLARCYLRDTNTDEMIDAEHHSVSTSSPGASAGVEDTQYVTSNHTEQKINTEPMLKLNDDAPTTIIHRATRRTYDSLWCMGTTIMEHRKFRQELA